MDAGQFGGRADRRHRDGDDTGWPYADTVVAGPGRGMWVLPRAFALARAALRILSSHRRSTSMSPNSGPRWPGSTA